MKLQKTNKGIKNYLNVCRNGSTWQLAVRDIEQGAFYDCDCDYHFLRQNDIFKNWAIITSVDILFILLLSVTTVQSCVSYMYLVST